MIYLPETEENPQAGIGIVVQPPGKKLQTLALLSGGERALTAIALPFAVYQTRPSPFCILDEIDAPLDDPNISRFLTILDRFLEQSQFIIITHNKRTMEAADTIYGVTMAEVGISTIISIDFQSRQHMAIAETPEDLAETSKTDKSIIELSSVASS